MKNCYCYYPVEPLLPRYQDNESITPLFTVSVQTASKTYEVALFGTNQTMHVIRIMIPDVEEGPVIPETEARIIYALKEHMLSILRITYDHDVSFYPRFFWTFAEAQSAPALNVAIEESVDPGFHINVENIRNTFVSTLPVRNEVKLFSDAQDRRIPLQYRYLSLYKVLELEFKEERDWRRPEFQNLMEAFTAEFRALGISRRKLENYVHALRDRCAHFQRGRGLFGVTMLSSKDAAEVERFLPLMTKISAVVLNSKYKDKGFQIVISPPRSSHTN